MAPDVFVAKGLAKAKALRDFYKVWEEGRPPCWILEITSKGTRQEDEEKKELYRTLGVEEYVLFDPREEYLRPSLQAFRLAEGAGSEYQAVPLEEGGTLVSPLLGLVFRREGQRLRFFNSQTRKPYLDYQEKTAALRNA